ncbi:MAG TPA: ligase-associated DNA damage response exonuclease, partial [Xanthomonadales bacterium]|nr:ligase-associated DNA damage response exonuclease [Xanthomonadales bacterium]
MASNDLVQLRPEGLHCPAGDFWIDPWRPVPRALITHGHGDHARWGMGSYLATRESLGILRTRLGPEAAIETVEYGAPLDLGDVRVSFHPAGHVLGSAQIRIERGDETWVVSGDYKRAHDPTCAPFEVVPCDVLITEATFGLPVYRWVPGAQVAADVLSWWDENAARGRASVLFCYALGKAQRLLAEMALQADRVVYVHGALLELVAVYRAHGIRMLPTEAVSEQGRGKDYAGAL